jgi:hypothetical protein
MRSKSKLRKKECPLCLDAHGIYDLDRDDWSKACEEHRFLAQDQIEREEFMEEFFKED